MKYLKLFESNEEKLYYPTTGDGYQLYKTVTKKQLSFSPKMLERISFIIDKCNKSHQYKIRLFDRSEILRQGYSKSKTPDYTLEIDVTHYDPKNFLRWSEKHYILRYFEDDWFTSITSRSGNPTLIDGWDGLEQFIKRIFR